MLSEAAQTKQMSTYQPYHAAKAHILTELARSDEALTSLKKALELSDSTPQRRFLESQIQHLNQTHTHTS